MNTWYSSLDLNYMVVSHIGDKITAKARFDNKAEADWYAANIFNAALKRDILAVMRVVDIRRKLEITIFGTKQPLLQNKVNLIATTLVR